MVLFFGGFFFNLVAAESELEIGTHRDDLLLRKELRTEQSLRLLSRFLLNHREFLFRTLRFLITPE
jgi:hypothetical protein